MPALDTLPAASEQAFLTNLYADLKICTKACLINRPVVTGPNTVKVGSVSPMDKRFAQCVGDRKINVRHLGANYLAFAVGSGSSVGTPMDPNNGSDGIAFQLTVTKDTIITGLDSVVLGGPVTCALYLRNGGVRHDLGSGPFVSSENGWRLAAEAPNLITTSIPFPVFRNLDITLAAGVYGVFLRCPDSVNYRDFVAGVSTPTYTSGGVTIDVSPAYGYGGDFSLRFNPRMFRGTIYFIESLVRLV